VLEEENVLKIIAGRLNSLPESQRKLGEYILDHYRETANLSALDLGNRAGVSDATVVRFAKSLGFSGYLEIKRQLILYLAREDSPSERMFTSLKQVEQVGSAIAEVFQNDMKNIEDTLQSFSPEALEQSVAGLCQARRIYILGLNSCESLARFLNFHLHRLNMDVHLVTSGGLVMFERLAPITAQDVLVVFSYPRYSRDTLNAIDLARSRGAMVISITDKAYSPIAEAADILLLARSSSPGFYNSYAAATTICNVLVFSVALVDREKALDALKSVEEIKKDIYL